MEDYIGNIQQFAFGFEAGGCYVLCDGRSLPIAQFTPLFALIGCKFGGDGHTNFNVPDLRPEEKVYSATIGSNGGQINKSSMKRNWYDDEIKSYICTQGIFPCKP